MSPDTSAGGERLNRTLGLPTAIFVVIANMIGTGVFTTTGLLLADLRLPVAVLIAWAIGGMLALLGALAYAELATTLGRNGGEYRFLSDLYHPALGFCAGFVSFVVGFSAPIAASAVAFGSYLHAIVPAVPALWAATVLIVLVSVMHAVRVEAGALVQNVFAAAKVLLLVVFIAGASWYAQTHEVFVHGVPELGRTLVSPAFAVALIFVSFAYSGWNGAAYLAEEVRDPKRNLPLALGIGTAVVTLLYVALNGAFLVAAPSSELWGTIEVGHVAATRLFGERAGALLSGMIALALVSSVSAMIMVGPRVYEAMGDDYRRLSFLSARTKRGGPARAIALQAVLACILLWTSSFDALLVYIGFTLALFTALTVGGLFIARRRIPREQGATTYRTWGYPVTPVVFIAFALWTAGYSISERPTEALWGLATVLAGFVAYRVVRADASQQSTR